MIKILIFSLFLSGVIFSQDENQTEQTRFDFPGYTIKGCLGSDLSKPKRQVAKLPSKKAQAYLKDLFPFLRAETEDLVKAKNVLNRMQSDQGLTESDKAQMYYYFAYIDSINEDLKSAKNNYKKFLSIEDADPRLKSNVISMLGQLSYSEGNYKTAIDYMEQWISMEANPSSLGFDIIAASHWQLKEKKKALKFSERALCVAKANKSLILTKSIEDEIESLVNLIRAQILYQRHIKPNRSLFIRHTVSHAEHQVRKRLFSAAEAKAVCTDLICYDQLILIHFGPSRLRAESITTEYCEGRANSAIWHYL